MIGFVREQVPSHANRIVLLLLWTLLLIWLRPWTGDLRSDPLAYACIAKDMVENNHWFSPMLDGSPYLNKPPFYFWLVALSFKVFGVSFYATKIPSLLFATGSVLLLYWVAYRWFEDHDVAFFSAFAFVTTRWIIRNFTTNRPESLLVLTILLGCYGLVLMNTRDRRGPYLLGIAFALGFLTKVYFALFLPAAVLLYGILTRRIAQWSRWSPVYSGGLLGILLASAWFLYYESVHPGYFLHITRTQTFQRITDGLDVNRDPLMYLKEMIKYYHPWLILFVFGIPLLWKKARENDYALFVLLSVVIMFIPLQVAQGKADRYLTMVTPFLSVAAAFGVCRFERARKFLKGFAAYSLIPLFLFFWIVPVKVNPEKYHVLHLAERLSKGEKIEYTDSLSFLRSGKGGKEQRISFAEWTPSKPGMEYRLSFYFYLSGSFEHWENERMKEWAERGGSPVLLVTVPSAVESLPRERVHWVELSSDRYHALLTGVPE
ncbi:MAG: ArnT family glycosyltransferase [bacterium]